MANTVFRFKMASGQLVAPLPVANLKEPGTGAAKANAGTDYALTEATVIGNGWSYYEITVSEDVTGNVDGYVTKDGEPVDEFSLSNVTNTVGPFIEGHTSSASGGGSGSVPVPASSDVEVVRADDYLNANARALSWTETVADKWPDLSTATSIVLRVSRECLSEVQVGSDQPVVVTQATGLQAYRADAPQALTTLLKPGKYKYQVIADFSGNEITIRKGNLTSTFKIVAAA